MAASLTGCGDVGDDTVTHLASTSSHFPTPCAGKAPKIQAINPKVVHKICSGQVIVTLSIAIKELVENSIDAGATNIDIRLKEHGSKMIEVCDNGVGVEEDNLEGLTLKHHTSKITDFEDLTTVETFGFRGEALSSLCALAKLSVITKSANAEGPANRIEYDSRGKIVKRTKCARENGTTIILEDLFEPLPVRRREFVKNLKREFNKMVNVLYGYGLISTGIRINGTNQIGNKIANFLSIPALPTMKERIMTLFGSKLMSSLLEIRQSPSVPDEILEEFGLSETAFCSTKYTLEGFISFPNKGRSSNDRQYFWINSRPCEPNKISRLINEVFHTYSRNQNPFVCLHIQTKQEEVDVNVTPDKRVIYLQNEKILCAIVKATLLSLYSSASCNFNSANQQMVALTPNLHGPLNPVAVQTESSKGSDTYCSSKEKFMTELNSKEDIKKALVASPARINTSSIKRILEGFAKTTDQCDNANSSHLHSPMLPRKEKTPKEQSIEVQSFDIATEEERIYDNEGISNVSECKIHSEYDESPFFPGNRSMPTADAERDSGIFLSCLEGSENQISQSPLIMHDDDFDDDFNPSQISVSLKVNWDKVKLTTTNTKSEDKKYFRRKFRARIFPNESASAEDELKKQITKNMFSEMKIIGQFNLGFIVVKSGPDIFIVDQHASDEKYNFETLEKTTILIGQTLIRPMDLQLPAISENVIIDNLDIFHKNGFDFEINVEGHPSNRIKMTKIPYSKSVQFGKTDVEELVFMMEDCPEKSFCRPSKVREMLASRACRKSVMIGTAMNHQEMRAIINHMGLINQPWNCPHGRPTIRHLLNFNLLPDIELNMFNHSTDMH